MSTLPHVDAPLRLAVRHDDGVPVLVVPDALPFDRLREWVRAHLPEVVASLGGRPCRLDLGARELQLFDVRRLLHLLRDEFHVEATGLYVQSDAVHRYAERELKLRLFLRDPAGTVSVVEGPPPPPADDEAPEVQEVLPGLGDVLAALTDADGGASAEAEAEVDATDDPPTEDTSGEAAPAALTPSLQPRPVPLPDLPKEGPDVDESGGRRVLTLTRTLRSGTAVHYDGDLHVYGDVNAGAQVRAGGSVVVFGRLRGVVHAGAQGDEGAFVLAFEMAPTQVRIAKHIAIVPQRPPADSFVPEVARVRDGSVVIETWQGRWIAPAPRQG